MRTRRIVLPVLFGCLIFVAAFVIPQILKMIPSKPEEIIAAPVLPAWNLMASSNDPEIRSKAQFILTNHIKIYINPQLIDDKSRFAFNCTTNPPKYAGDVGEIEISKKFFDEAEPVAVESALIHETIHAQQRVAGKPCPCTVDKEYEAFYFQINFLISSGRTDLVRKYWPGILDASGNLDNNNLRQAIKRAYPSCLDTTTNVPILTTITVSVLSTVMPSTTFTLQYAENILVGHEYSRTTTSGCTFPECFSWYRTNPFDGVVIGGCNGWVYGVSFFWDNNVEDSMKNSIETEAILGSLPVISVLQIKQIQNGGSISVNGWTISTNVNSVTFNHPNICIPVPTLQYTATSEPIEDLNAPGARYMLDQYGRRVPYVEGKGTLQIAGYYQAPNGKWYPIGPPSTTSTPQPGKHWCQWGSDELCLTSWANNQTPSNK